MTKATVVSLFPKKITTHQPGTFPGYHEVAAAPKDGYSSLVVGDAFYWITFIEEERASIKQVIPANTVAESIVNDFIRNIPGYNTVADAMPGLFVIPTEVKHEVIATSHKKELDAARGRQNRWYRQLVLDADDLWNKTRQHRLITSLQREACRSLGFTRDWLVELTAETGPKFCDACKTKVHPEAVICPACSFILNAEKYAKMNFVNKKA